MSSMELELYELLKLKLGEKEFDNRKDNFLTKQDKVEIIKSIYLVGLIQYLAMLASLIAIIKFLM